jgi:hypothetical protein
MRPTRYLGTCPVCYREQKLHKMLMVHHGYQRPGYGYIQGDCFGVGWTPFELSPDGTIAYVERVLQPQLERNQEFLQQLQAGTVTELYVKTYEGFGRHGMKKITIEDGYTFKQEVRNRIKETDRLIGQLTQDIAERVAKVAQWHEAPVRTEDEVLQQRSRMTEARRAALDEARAAKQAKRATLDAKQRAREQEKLDLIDEYRSIFQRLARVSLPSDEAKSQAKQHWIKLWRIVNKKSYLHFYPEKLEADDALQRLGLAVPSRHRAGRMEYANDMGWEPRS